MDAYTIGQLATAANVPTSTIRYYERSGLLKPDFRTGGNYRGYTPNALERLRFIRSAQATGFSLQDVLELLKLTYSSDPPCDEVLSLMRGRLAQLREKIQELRHVEKALARSLDDCCKGKGPDLCDDICRLKGKQSGALRVLKNNSARRP